MTRLEQPDRYVVCPMSQREYAKYDPYYGGRSTSIFAEKADSSRNAGPVGPDVSLAEKDQAKAPRTGQYCSYSEQNSSCCARNRQRGGPARVDRLAFGTISGARLIGGRLAEQYYQACLAATHIHPSSCESTGRMEWFEHGIVSFDVIIKRCCSSRLAWVKCYARSLVRHNHAFSRSQSQDRAKPHVPVEPE